MRAFFADVYASGIRNVTITPAHTGFGGDAYLFAPPSSSPSGALCADTQSVLLYWAAAPFGENTVCDLNGQNCGYRPTGAFDNSAYNCSSRNPIFVGWQNMYNVINAMLNAAATRGLTVTELDIENEADYQNFPVHARFLVDNAHTNTGNPDSVNSLRYYMGTANRFDPGRVTTSTFTISANTANWNCTNVYNDYARLTPLNEFASAIGGGVIGLPSGYDASTGLVCGGSTSGMYQMPVSHTQPNIVDIHSYACVIDPANGQCRLDDVQAQNEARINFSDVVHYLALRNVTSSLIMLGETWSNSNAGNGRNCEGGVLGAAKDTVVGYNASSLAGHSVIFRPWHNVRASCYSYPDNFNVNLGGAGPYTPTHQ